MDIRHPQAESILASRNALLQAALRPAPPLFPIASEYPLVLSAAEAAHSYCLLDGSDVIGHANLWPRELLDPCSGKRHRIGLVGNVATAAERRGQGLSRQLFQHIENEAKRQELEAIVLWSDLEDYYIHLGFQPWGKEDRWHFKLPISSLSSPSMQISRVSAAGMHPAEFAHLLSLRYGQDYLCTLGRSANEFQQLLAIPAAYLYVAQSQNSIRAFAIIGKGYDMVNVMHEWGGDSPKTILAIANLAARDLQTDELMLLAPPNLDALWLEPWQRYCKDRESLPLAFVKPLAAEHGAMACLSRGFIWGLDSI